MLLTLRPLWILRKHWKLSAVAVFSLSIAMAIGILSLSVTNTFFFLPPAGVDPDRLVMIHSRMPGEEIGRISYPDYRYYRENNHVFSDIAAVPTSINVNTNVEAGREVKLVSRPVSDNYFTVLGIQPFLGSFFSPGDDNSASSGAVMTYAGWMRLGADPQIVGKKIIRYTIIGVAPKEFTGSLFGLNGDLLFPLSMADDKDTSWFNKRDARYLFLIGRLKPGITKAQAQAEVATLARQVATAYPKENTNLEAVVTRATMLPPDAIPDAQIALSILMLVVMLVLLIACANVANLLLAVAVSRRQEAAIKLALGAQRGRLIREFLRESAVICGVGAVFGYFIAASVIARYTDITIDLPMMGRYSVGLDLRLDATVLMFTAGLMIIAIVATGLAPALYASSPNLSQMLSGEIVVGGTRKNTRRNVLVIAQVAVCTLVLVGMGLCVRSLHNLRRADPGFSARNLVAATVYPRTSNDSPDAQRKQMLVRLRRVVSELPGVESVGFTRILPLAFGYNSEPAQIPATGEKISVAVTAVDGDYFATLGIPILAGRVFNARDRESNTEVVMINRKFSETFWPGQDAVGKSFMTGEPQRKVVVVGVTADGKYEDLDEPNRPVMYFAVNEQDEAAITVIARTAGDPRRWVEPIDQTMRALGAFTPISPLTFNDLLDFNLLVQRVTAACAAGLSSLGLLLALLGLFGTISYSVSERKKELGIRVALGARPWELLMMIWRQTLGIAGIGIAIGIILGVGATALLRAEFYGVSPVEWTVLVPVGLFMVVLSLLVAYLSARSWIRIDPMESVRHA